MKNRILAAIVASALLVACFSGCNENTESKPNTQSNSSSSQANNESKPADSSSSSSESSSSSVEESSSSAPESKPESSSTPESSSSKPQSSSSKPTSPSSKPASSSSKPQSSSSSKPETPPEKPKVKLGNALTLKKDDVYTIGEKAAVIKIKYTDEYGSDAYKYKLVDLSGKALVNKEFDTASGFTKEGYVSLGGDLYDSTGKLIIKNCIRYSDGIILTQEKTGDNPKIPISGVPVYKYTLMDKKTGKVYFTADAMKELYSGGFTYEIADFSGIYDSSFGTEGKTFLYYAYSPILAGKGNSTMRLVSTKYGNVDIVEKIKPLADKDSILSWSYVSGSGTLVVLSQHIDDKSYQEVTDKVFLYDIVTGKVISCDLQTRQVHYLRSCNMAIVGKASNANADGISSYIITDAAMKTVYLDGLTSAGESGSTKYLLVSNGKRWGYFDVKTRKTTWYDDATNFKNGYAFVIQNGKGHFVDENLKAVSDDITASGATFYSPTVICIDNKYHMVNLPK